VTVCVFGMWHLGCVTAFSLANKGIKVECLDLDLDLFENFQKDILPIYEPGLEDLYKNNKNNISFNCNPSCVSNCDYLWVTFDTPVNDNDEADVNFVKDQIEKVIPHLRPGCKIIISSQLPLGTTKQLEQLYPHTFAYIPENLRLGQAIEIFNNPDRIVLGIREDVHFNEYKNLLEKITSNILVMKTEAAEMVKHTINSFLATCIVFANEIARVCDEHGVNVLEVESGFLSEARVASGNLPLKSGLGFAGGTLARDVNFVSQLNSNLYLLKSIMSSNIKQNDWCYETLQKINKENAKVGVIGVTYKPDTNTLRRSTAIEFCNKCKNNNYKVEIFDEQIKENTVFDIIINNDLISFLERNDVIVIFSKKMQINDINLFNNKTIIDPNGFYYNILSQNKHCIYYRVGVLL
jgi:UDPglucose 6-dehydrogenase